MRRIVKLELPYPPTANTMWRLKRGGGVYLTADAVSFRDSVYAAWLDLGEPGFGKHRVGVEITLYPGDNRRRDIDNVIKPVLDAMEKAGIYKDDQQVDSLKVYKESKRDEAHCVVRVWSFYEQPKQNGVEHASNHTKRRRRNPDR